MSGRGAGDTSIGGEGGVGSLPVGPDSGLLPEGELAAGQALAVAFPLIRLDLDQHRAESLVGDDGALRDVRILVEEDAAGEKLPCMTELGG